MIWGLPEVFHFMSFTVNLNSFRCQYYYSSVSFFFLFKWLLGYFEGYYLFDKDNWYFVIGISASDYNTINWRVGNLIGFRFSFTTGFDVGLLLHSFFLFFFLPSLLPSNPRAWMWEMSWKGTHSLNLPKNGIPILYCIHLWILLFSFPR